MALLIIILIVVTGTPCPQEYVDIFSNKEYGSGCTCPKGTNGNTLKDGCTADGVQVLFVKNQNGNLVAASVEVPCPPESTGKVVSGCTPLAGYMGNVVATATSPFYESTLQAVPCPTGSNGVSVVSGCTADAEHTGVVVASTVDPFFTQTLVSASPTITTDVPTTSTPTDVPTTSTPTTSEPTGSPTSTTLSPTPIGTGIISGGRGGLVIDASADGSTIVSIWSNIEITRDFGTTWTGIAMPTIMAGVSVTADGQTIKCMPSSPYPLIQNGVQAAWPVLQSTDYGATWHNGGLLNLYFIQPHAFECNSGDATVCVAGGQAQDGAYYISVSRDGGATWPSPVNIGLLASPIHNIHVSRDGSRVLLKGGRNGGGWWLLQNSNADFSAFHRLTTVCPGFDENLQFKHDVFCSPDLEYCIVHSQTQWWHTRDNFATCTLITKPATKANNFCFFGVSADGGRYLAVCSDGALHKSTDQGASWTTKDEASFTTWDYGYTLECADDLSHCYTKKASGSVPIYRAMWW